MKVLVTGGAGYIGSVTTEMLLDQGHEVLVFDNLERGHKEAVDKRALFTRGDIRIPEDIDSATKNFGPDAIMHFAAYALVGESMEHPEWYFGNNLRGSINLAEAMIKNDVKRIVFSSTCATYGQPDTPLITETTPQRPFNPYGESKLMFEKVLDWYNRIYNLEPVLLRYFNACGASAKYGEDHRPETHIIPNVLKVALNQADSIPVNGDDYDTPDGTCVRDYIHIMDLAAAHITALSADVTGPFNLGTGNGYSVRQVIDTAREITGHPIPEQLNPRRAGDPDSLVASPEKANTVLGWRPENSSLENIITTAWDWHKQYPEGY